MKGHLVTPFQGEKFRVRLADRMSQLPSAEVNEKA